MSENKPTRNGERNSNDSKDKEKARSIEVYKNALIRALKDGVLTLEEDAILTELRKTLKISMAMHRNLQSEIIKTMKLAAKKQSIEELILKIEGSLQQAKDASLKVNKAEQLLEEAKTAFTKGSFNESKIFLSSAKKIIEDSKRHKKVETQLMKVQAIIADAKNMGASIKESTKCISMAKKALNIDDFPEARKNITLAKKLVTERKRYKKELLRIQKAQKLIKRLKRKEIRIPEIEQLLNKSEAALKKGDYAKVSKNIANINRVASKVTQIKHIQDQIKKADELVKTTKKMGANVGISEDLLKSAKLAFKQNDFKRVSTLIVSANKATHEVARSKKITDLIIDLHLKIELAKDFGGTVTTANRLGRQAEAALKKRNYSKASLYGRRALKSAIDAKDSALRRSAKSAVNNIRFLIAEIKGFGGETTKSKSLLKDLEKLIKKRKYEEASQLGREAEEYTKNTLENVRKEELKGRAKESIEAVEFVINETKEMGADVTEAEERLEDMKKMFGQGEYENIVEYVKEAEDLAKKAIDDFKLKHRVEKITDSMEATDKLIQEVKNMGIDVEEAELLLREAESMFQSKDYKDINSYLTKAHDAVKVSKQQYLVDKTSVAISTTQSLISDAEGLGADVSEANELLKEADALFQVEDYEAVDDYLKKAESLAKESWFQQRTQIASDAISSTRELIKETKGMGADVTDAEDLLKQVESMFKDKDFKRVDEYIKKAESSVLESKDHYRTQIATVALSDTRALIEETRLMGVDVEEAENLLREAESMFEEHDFDAVDEYIKKSTILVEDIKLQHREQVSTNELAQVYKSLAEAKDLKIDVSAVEQFMKTAEDKLKVKDFDAVDEYLTRSQNILVDLKDRHIKENITEDIKKVKNSIFEAKQLGLNTEPYNELLQQAESAFEAKNFEEAEDIAKQAKKMIEDSKHEYLSESIVGLLNNIKSMITEADTLGIDTTTPQKSFNQAEAFFKSKDYEKAKSFAIKAEGELNETAKDHIQDTFPKLTLDLPKEGLQVGTWNKYSFEITNEGKISAKDINFEVTGKDLEVKGMEKVPSLEVGETQRIEVGVKPETEGDIPIDLRVSYYRPFDHAEYEVEQEEEVKIASSGTYVINDAFLIYKDGIMISHASREFREDMDEDIFSGMLTAVQDFIKDSFQRTGNVGLRRLDFGPNKILIERGKNLFIAVILAGTEPKFLPLFIIEIINKIEEKYGEILDDWSGKLDDLSGIDEYIDRLLEVTVTEEGKLGDGVDSSLVPLQMLISEAKSMGSEVGEAEELLAKAENISGDEDFETVWKYVKRAENLVEHVKIQHYKNLAEDAFSTAEASITDAKKSGVKITEIENILSNARNAMDTGDYEDALAIAEECREAVVKAEKHHEVASIVDSTKAKAEDIKAQGFEIEAVDKKLEEATVALEHEDYEQVIKIIDRADKLIDKSMMRVDDKLLGEIESVTSLISEVKKSGVDTGDADELLKQARTSLDNKDLEAAQNYIDKSRDAASVSKQDYVQSMASKAISSLESLLEDSREEEASLENANEYIQLAEVAYSNGDFEQAEEYSRKVEEIMSKVKEDEDTKVLRETIKSTELLLEEAKSSGSADTTEVEDFLNRAKAALEGKEYRSAEEIAMEAETLAKSTRELVVATQKAKGEGEVFKAPPGSPEEALIVALTGKKEVKPTDEHLTSIREMLDKMREPYREQIAQKDISNLETELEDARNADMDVSAVEEYLEQAKACMDENDLTEAEKFIEEAKSAMQITKEEHRMFMISETVKSTNKFIEEAKELGADVTNAKELLELAESRVNVGDLDTAEEYLSNALNTAKEIKTDYLKRKANEAIEFAGMELKHAKDEKMRVGDAEKLFKQAQVVFEEEDYETATKYANHARDLIEEAKGEHSLLTIKNTITTARAKSDEIKKLGADVTKVEALLGQATLSLNSNDYQAAEVQSKEAEEVLDQNRQPYLSRIITTSINSVWAQIEEAKKYSADNDEIRRSEELFNSAKSALDKKDYKTVEEYLKESEELAVKSKEEHYGKYLENEIEKIKTKVLELKGIGIDVEEIDKSVLKIEAAFDKKDFANIGNLMKSTRGLISSVERVKYLEKASDAISFSKALVKYIKHNIKGIGTKINSAESFLKQAGDAFNHSNYFEAEKLAINCKESVEQIKHPKLEQFTFVFKQLRAEEIIDDTRNLFKSIKKIGVDLSAAEENFKKGEELLHDGDDATYDEGRGYLTQAKISAKDVEREFHRKNASSAISAAHSLIIDIKKSGADIVEPKKLLDQGKAAFEDGEYKKSILFAGKAKLAAKKFQQ